MAASPKAPLRTSEDVFNRLRWDPSLAGEGEGAEAQVWIGFEDRILGPLEVKLEEFVPMSEGGELPYHRIFYYRRGDEVLWDRRRRFDSIFGSGDTPGIEAAHAAHRQRRRHEAPVQRLELALAQAR